MRHVGTVTALVALVALVAICMFPPKHGWVCVYGLAFCPKK